MDEAEERRKAENEAIFRDANERIRDARVELLSTTGPTPFLCECSAPECRTIVMLELADYEFARSNARHFIVADGHPDGGGDPVRDGDGYTIVAKDGVAGEVAEATDPRAEA